MEKYIIKNRDIIVVGQQPWDTEIGSNNKNIAMEFSRYNRVIYVNPALDVNTFLKRSTDPKIKKRLSVIKGRQSGLEQLAGNLYTYYPDTTVLSINWIKSTPVFSFFNRLNNKRFAKSILKAAKQLGFKDYILFNDSDMFRSFYLKEFLKPSISIYYSRDNMVAVDYWRRHGLQLEPELIAKSDLCMANSTYLADYCRQYNPKSYYVGQGCDLSLFNTATAPATPADMLPIAQPIIGYVGALQSLRLDLDLIAHIAQSKPEWNIVLVGPEDDDFKASKLHQINNVFFLGSKPGDMLPAYINAFDVCINPQAVNPVTIGNYPRKIDEYLAMGKPVVATSTRAMEIFSQHTYLGQTADEYIVLISQALAEDSESKQTERKNFAATHTWENNLNEIYKAILTYNQ